MSLPNAIVQIANVSLFAKEYSPQTNNYLLNTKKQLIPYRIVGGRGEKESSICRDPLIGKAEDILDLQMLQSVN